MAQLIALQNENQDFLEISSITKLISDGKNRLVFLAGQRVVAGICLSKSNFLGENWWLSCHYI
jgi:hypothetical protein